MIEKLRKKFIIFTMIAVMSVFAVIILGVNGLFFYRTVNELDSTTQMIVNSDGHLRKAKNENNNNPNPDPNANPKADDTEMRNEEDASHQNNQNNREFKNKEMPYATRYFFARTDEELNIIEVNTEYIASVEQDEAEDIISGIIKSGDETGWNGTRRYRISKIKNGYMAVVLDAENQVKYMISILGITFLVSAVSIAVLYIIIRLIARKAVRPIAESYDKQKQFITDAGHELKTPLTAISANMEIVKMTAGESKWTDAVDRQTDKMINLINNLISLSKMDEGKIEQEITEFSFSEAVLDTVESLGSIAVKKEIVIETDIQPDILIVNDESMLRQLVSILMDNALKYCDEHGKVSVILHSHNHSFGKNKTILMIQNDFADAEKFEPDKVFDRFYRGNKAHTSNGSFGLGLSIARNIAESCGIKLSADKSDSKVIFTAVV